MTIVETLRRPVPAAATALAGLTALAWIVLFFEAMSRGGGYGAFVEALCAPAELVGVRSFGDAIERLALSIGVWIAMSVAMMLPTASLLVVGFADRLEARGRGAAGGSPALLLAGGYLSVWILVSIVAATLQALVAASFASVAIPEAVATILAGAALGAAGFYQFSGLKRACLFTLRHPFDDDTGSALPADRAAFRLGLAQGVRCVGCCGAMMGMLVVLGAMNIVWMAFFGAIMAAEKMSNSERLPGLVGIALIAAGTLLSLSAVGGDAITAWLLG
jgi:predicted metal-binding membrane protein